MVVKLLVVVRADVATRKQLFEVLEERGSMAIMSS